MKGILLTILTLLLPLSLAAKPTDKANVSLADSLAVVDKALAAYQQPAENDVHYVELLYRKTCLLNEMGHFADALPVAIQLLDIATPDLVGEDGMAVLLSQALRPSPTRCARCTSLLNSTVKSRTNTSKKHPICKSILKKTDNTTRHSSLHASSKSC